MGGTELTNSSILIKKTFCLVLFHLLSLWTQFCPSLVSMGVAEISGPTALFRLKILFCSFLFCSFLFCSVLSCSVLFCSACWVHRLSSAHAYGVRSEWMLLHGFFIGPLWLLEITYPRNHVGLVRAGLRDSKWTYSQLLVREPGRGNIQLEVWIGLVQVVVLDGFDENGVIGFQAVEVLVDVTLLGDFLLPLAEVGVFVLTSGNAVVAGNANKNGYEVFYTKASSYCDW